MNFTYDNVYINATSTVVGPYEKKGPLGKLFDKSYKEFYFNEKSFEEAESRLIMDSVSILLDKLNMSKNSIDVQISGDLLNQISATNYAASNLSIPLIGIYAACASSILGLIIASNMIDSKQISNCICSVSSHNLSAEKQFRYPNEYGGPKHKSTTFTCTGSASAYLSSKKSDIKVESATLGTVIEMGINDVSDMGAVMAPAAATTLYDHLKLNKRDISYYDLILTGDLGIVGKKIFKDYLNMEYGIKITNYNDCGTILYDLNNQPVYSGASGPACLPLVSYTKIFDEMRKGKYKKVLLIATGALHSLTMANLKKPIPSVAHAISLEVVE